MTNCFCIAISQVSEIVVILALLTYLGVPVFLIGVAIWTGVAHRSWKVFGKSVLQLGLGIWLPLVVFVLSFDCAPNWKGAARFGWIDFYHAGKLWMLPLVLWAVAAFFYIHVSQKAVGSRPWIRFGILNGALVAAASTILGFVTGQQGCRGMEWFMMVPVYTTIWYGWLSWRIFEQTASKSAAHLINILATAPFWIASALQSRSMYQRAPDVPPDCFVVTAASRGHTSVVGPLQSTLRLGRQRMANRQLLVMWIFEDLWRSRASASHRFFRAIYNRIAPYVARRIKSPFVADVVYCLLKPIEFVAHGIVICFPRQSCTSDLNASFKCGLKLKTRLQNRYRQILTSREPKQ